uniref:kelch-like protein 12 n=1 Tax=Erigeron canadensis TaxID=72917 RepID=UPI001CB95FCE|nr:kelch-like protein 12 [Erigeron canadensis]
MVARRLKIKKIVDNSNKNDLQLQKKRKIDDKNVKEAPATSINRIPPVKNLKKTDTGAVIFGCKHSTYNECLSKRLFGLPESHYSYIKNISKGLVLFLFNYSDRKLHGIFEAVGPGLMNIDKSAWVEDGNVGCTDFPAQVRVRVRLQCQPLSEKQFGPIIAKNYYKGNRFSFELDHNQTTKLITLFKSSSMNASVPQPLKENVDPNLSSSTETNENDENQHHKKDKPGVVNRVAEQETSADLQSMVHKLMQEVQVLKGSQLKQIVKINMLEKDLVESKQESQQLRSSLLDSRAQSNICPAEVDSQSLNKIRSTSGDSVYIVGGFDGSSWLSTLDSYYPSDDHKLSHSSMKCVKQYASAATFNGELYHFGGVGYHSVESFSPTRNQWITRPPLFWKNIHVAGASVNEKLFVVGGEQGGQSSSEVEFLDLNIGKWLPTRSMQSKRLAPAAAELNNALYVTGGYDGMSYLSSVERFDPREDIWCKFPDMKTKKKCHSSVVLNEKLYTLGGFDGEKYVATVETFDTRMGSWVEAESMNVSRGNFGAFVVGEKLYAVGGVKENGELLDIVECYEEGSRWEVAPLKAIGKRSHFSAIVL